MKKIVSSLAMIICLMVISSISAFTQEQDQCRLEGNACKGTCGTWYWGIDQQNQQPKVAGEAKCHKVIIGEHHGTPVFDCHCFLIVTATRCRHGECNDDGCPNVYASIGEAMRGENPIKGTCINQGTGENSNCACKYEYPKSE